MTEALIRPSDGKTVQVTGKVAKLLRLQGWRPAGDRTAQPPKVGFVPTASVREVLAWVGDVPARAEAAIESEERRDKPRKSLLAQLRKLV